MYHDDLDETTAQGSHLRAQEELALAIGQHQPPVQITNRIQWIRHGDLIRQLTEDDPVEVTNPRLIHENDTEIIVVFDKV